MSNDSYRIKIAGLERELPMCPLNEATMIAGFVIFGDVELTCACAEELLKRAPEFDYIVTPEAKAIPLAYEMAKQCGMNDYIVVRKAMKLYMKDAMSVDDKSITTAGEQKLFLNGADAEKIAGKRIIIVDDVVSTGGSMAAVENLVNRAGGIIAGKMAVLAEGSAAERKDIIYLEPLPLFDSEGNPIK